MSASDGTRLHRARWVLNTAHEVPCLCFALLASYFQLKPTRSSLPPTRPYHRTPHPLVRSVGGEVLGPEPKRSSCLQFHLRGSTQDNGQCRAVVVEAKPRRPARDPSTVHLPRCTTTSSCAGLKSVSPKQPAYPASPTNLRLLTNTRATGQAPSVDLNFLKSYSTSSLAPRLNIFGVRVRHNIAATTSHGATTRARYLEA